MTQSRMGRRVTYQERATISVRVVVMVMALVMALAGALVLPGQAASAGRAAAGARNRAAGSSSNAGPIDLSNPGVLAKVFVHNARIALVVGPIAPKSSSGRVAGVRVTKVRTMDQVGRLWRAFDFILVRAAVLKGRHRRPVGARGRTRRSGGRPAPGLLTKADLCRLRAHMAPGAALVVRVALDPHQAAVADLAKRLTTRLSCGRGQDFSGLEVLVMGADAPAGRQALVVAMAKEPSLHSTRPLPLWIAGRVTSMPQDDLRDWSEAEQAIADAAIMTIPQTAGGGGATKGPMNGAVNGSVRGAVNGAVRGRHIRAVGWVLRKGADWYLYPPRTQMGWKRWKLAGAGLAVLRRAAPRRIFWATRGGLASDGDTSKMPGWPETLRTVDGCAQPTSSFLVALEGTEQILAATSTTFEGRLVVHKVLGTMTTRQWLRARKPIRAGLVSAWDHVLSGRLTRARGALGLVCTRVSKLLGGAGALLPLYKKCKQAEGLVAHSLSLKQSARQGKARLCRALNNDFPVLLLGRAKEVERCGR